MRNFFIVLFIVFSASGMAEVPSERLVDRSQLQLHINRSYQNLDATVFFDSLALVDHFERLSVYKVELGEKVAYSRVDNQSDLYDAKTNELISTHSLRRKYADNPSSFSYLISLSGVGAYVVARKEGNYVNYYPLKDMRLIDYRRDIESIESFEQRLSEDFDLQSSDFRESYRSPSIELPLLSKDGLYIWANEIHRRNRLEVDSHQGGYSLDSVALACVKKALDSLDKQVSNQESDIPIKIQVRVQDTRLALDSFIKNAYVDSPSVLKDAKEAGLKSLAEFVTEFPLPTLKSNLIPERGEIKAEMAIRVLWDGACEFSEGTLIVPSHEKGEEAQRQRRAAELLNQVFSK